MTTDALELDIVRLVEAVQVLTADVQSAARLSQTEDTQFARRAYVRSVFALVEGNINLMARVILNASQRKEISLEPKEIEILRQERQASKEAGKTVVRVKFVPMRDRTSPVFETFSRLFGKCFRLDKSSTGWNDFTTAIAVRNRITHPKDAASFKIDDSELNAVERSRQWFADSVEALLELCN